MQRNQGLSHPLSAMKPDMRPDCAAPNRLHPTRCVCAAARRTARSTTQLYDLVLAPVGLRSTQFVILQAIAEHGEVAQFQLASENAIAVETLSRRLAKLHQAGWIKVRLGGRKKEHIYSLTPEGMRILAEAKPHWVRAQARLADVLGGEPRLSEIIHVLDLLANAACEAQELRTSNSSRKQSRFDDQRVHCTESKVA